MLKRPLSLQLMRSGRHQTEYHHQVEFHHHYYIHDYFLNRKNQLHLSRHQSSILHQELHEMTEICAFQHISYSYTWPSKQKQNNN